MVLTVMNHQLITPPNPLSEIGSTMPRTLLELASTWRVEGVLWGIERYVIKGLGND